VIFEAIVFETERFEAVGFEAVGFEAVVIAFLAKQTGQRPSLPRAARFKVQV